MSAELLRRAAAKMRDDTPYLDDDAGWDSGAALAVAAWLDDVAAGWPWDRADFVITDNDGDELALEGSMDSHALAVARAFLGGGV